MYLRNEFPTRERFQILPKKERQPFANLRMNDTRSVIARHGISLLGVLVVVFVIGLWLTTTDRGLASNR